MFAYFKIVIFMKTAFDFPILKIREEKLEVRQKINKDKILNNMFC